MRHIFPVWKWALASALFFVLGCNKGNVEELPFPETEEEKLESVKTTISIDAIARPMITQIFEEAGGKKVSAKSIARKLRKIDGVLSVEVESDDLIVIKQNDGVYINVVLNSFKNESKQYDDGFSFRGGIDIPARSRETVNGEEVIVNNGKRALYLALNYDETMREFDDPRNNWEGHQYAKQLYDERYQLLKDLGYQVDSLLNSHVTIDCFRGNSLQQYDVIIVHSHGNHNVLLADGLSRSTIIKSGTRIDAGLPYSSDLHLQSFAMYNNGTYYMFTSPLLLADNPSLNDSWVFMQACYSYTDDDMADAFFRCGAAGYSGFRDEVHKRDGLILMNNLLKYLGEGNEADESFVLARDNSFFRDGNPVAHRVIFRSEKNPDYENTSCYLFNPTPFNLSESIAYHVPLSYELTWEMNPSLMDYVFEVFVGDVSVFKGKLKGENNIYTYTYRPETAGKGNWYVVSYYAGEQDSSPGFKSVVRDLDVRDFISIYPEVMKFGRVGSADDIIWKQKEFSITNTGQRDVKVWVESCPEDYSVSIGDGITIPASKTYNGVVIFYPWDEKVCNGTIVIQSDVGTTLSLEVEAEGYYNGATVGYLVDEVAFDRVMPGQSETRTIRVKNVGKNSGNLFSRDMRMTGDNCFSIDMPESLSLGAGQTTDISITFHPAAAGEYQASLSLTMDEKEYYVALPIRGTCMEFDGLSFSESSLDFGQVGVGYRTALPLDVTNSWKTGHSFSLYYEDCIRTESRDYYLDPGETKTIDFYFAPKETKKYEGTVLFVFEDGSRQRISYTGEGVIAPESITLNKYELNLVVGEKYQLVATVKPDNTTNKNVIWQTANPAVVTVDQTGLVTAVGKGNNVLILATTAYGGLLAKCYVSVGDTVSGNHEGTGEEYWD